MRKRGNRPSCATVREGAEVTVGTETYVFGPSSSRAFNDWLERWEARGSHDDAFPAKISITNKRSKCPELILALSLHDAMTIASALHLA